jgi:hypothetical protein
LFTSGITILTYLSTNNVVEISFKILGKEILVMENQGLQIAMFLLIAQIYFLQNNF